MDASDLPPGLGTRISPNYSRPNIVKVVLRACWLSRQQTRQTLGRGEILLPKGRPAVALEQIETMPDHFETLLGEGHQPTEQDLADAARM